MRGPTSTLEAAHEAAAGKEESGPPGCKLTNALDVRLGVCRNCRKFYKSGEVRQSKVLESLIATLRFGT
jgi:hypothetical protein